MTDVVFGSISTMTVVLIEKYDFLVSPPNEIVGRRGGLAVTIAVPASVAGTAVSPSPAFDAGSMAE